MGRDMIEPLCEMSQQSDMQLTNRLLTAMLYSLVAMVRSMLRTRYTNYRASATASQSGDVRWPGAAIVAFA